MAGTIDWQVPPESEYINTPHFAEYRQNLNFDDGKEEEAFNAVFLHVARYKDCLNRVLRVYTGSLDNIAATPPPQDIKYNISNESVYEAFWRSLICNLNACGQIPDPSSFENLYTYFHAWQMRFLAATSLKSPGARRNVTWFRNSNAGGTSTEEKGASSSRRSKKWDGLHEERRSAIMLL